MNCPVSSDVKPGASSHCVDLVGPHSVREMSDKVDATKTMVSDEHHPVHGSSGKDHTEGEMG